MKGLILVFYFFPCSVGNSGILVGAGVMNMLTRKLGEVKVGQLGSKGLCLSLEGTIGWGQLR